MLCWVPNVLFDGVCCKDGGELDVEGCGRWSVHDGSY
jgi:hypothetical protein